MSACEPCWAAASRRSFIEGRPVVELYREEIAANPDHEAADS